MIAITPRQDVPLWRSAAALAGGVAAGLLVTIAILVSAGVGLGDIWQEFVVYTLLDLDGLSLVATSATPLILVGLAGAVALRVRFWNIGIEGQVWLGAIGATWIAVADIGPDSLRLVFMAGAGALFGALWVAIPALMKLRLGINEIITTLLLNYVAHLLVQHLVFGPWKDPTANFPNSESFQPGVERLVQLGWGNVHAGLIVALAVALVLWVVMERSRAGLYMQAIGASPSVAAGTGLPVLATILLAVGLSGAAAGLAGWLVASGQEYRLTQHLGTGYGFAGIVIAFLARFRPAAVVVAAALVGTLYVAGDTLQVFYQLPRAVIELIQAVILLSVVTADFFARYRLTLSRPVRRPAPGTAAQSGGGTAVP
ncbi:ABC transporter permease [Marinibaculum pumilum]|uniref:ABC transporter permease n=1 Tax=Marinibaculum pumilum TaxID=1766165 RepID=A0ABV7LA78_9PROT